MPTADLHPLLKRETVKILNFGICHGPNHITIESYDERRFWPCNVILEQCDDEEHSIQMKKILHTAVTV